MSEIIDVMPSYLLIGIIFWSGYFWGCRHGRDNIRVFHREPPSGKAPTMRVMSNKEVSGE